MDPLKRGATKSFDMKERRRVGVGCILWIAFLVVVDGRVDIHAGQWPMGPQMEVTQETSHGLEEEHESNGPGGATGVPMQRASSLQVGLVVGLMLTTAGGFLFTSKDRNPRA